MIEAVTQAGSSPTSWADAAVAIVAIIVVGAILIAAFDGWPWQR